MTIFTTAFLIGILSTTSLGSYTSSKDTKCRSRCTQRIGSCPQGFSCERVPKNGCSRFVFECVKVALYPPTVVDPLFQVGGQRGQSKEDLQIVKELPNVLPSNVGIRGGGIIKDLPGGPGVQRSETLRGILPPVLVRNDVGPLRADIYAPGDDKVVKDSGLNNLPISPVNIADSFLPGNPFLPVDTHPLNDITSEQKRFSLGLCIDDCLKRTTCLQGTDCELSCKNICLKEESIIGVGPVVETLNGVQGIDKTVLPVNKKLLIKSNSNVGKDFQLISQHGGSVHDSDLKGPIVKSEDSYPVDNTPALIPVQKVEVDPFTGQIVSTVNVDGVFSNPKGTISQKKDLIDAQNIGVHGIVKPLLPGGAAHELELRGNIFKPVEAYPSDVMKGEGNIMSLNKAATNPLNRLFENSDNSFINQHAKVNNGLFDAHIGHENSALVDNGGHLHPLDVVLPIKSNGLGAKTVIVDSVTPVETDIGIRKHGYDGRFINQESNLGLIRNIFPFIGRNDQIIDPLVKKKAVGGSTLLVDDFGRAHLVDSRVKSAQPSSLELITTNPSNCFRECNKNSQCIAYENGWCSEVGCKRVCEYPTGSLPKQARRQY